MTIDIRFHARMLRRPAADKSSEYELMAPTTMHAPASSPRPTSNRAKRLSHHPVRLRTTADSTNTARMTVSPTAPMRPSCWPRSEGTTLPWLSSAKVAKAPMRWFWRGA